MESRDFDSQSRGKRGKPRNLPETRPLVATAPAVRKEAATTARLSVTVSQKLIQDCRILAIREGVHFSDLVAQSLQATLNRRPRFLEYLKSTEEVARSLVADPPEGSIGGEAA